MHKWLLFILAFVWLVGCEDRQWRTNDISEIMPPLDFELVNEDGYKVQEQTYLGKINLLYFGYTHCPDVCPATLAELAAATRQLDEEARQDIRVLFVSVDPTRDTPAVLKRYTRAFGPQFVGLTGDKADIDALTNRYRVTYSYGDEDAEGNYDVSHSSGVFAFNREGEAQFLIRDNDSMTEMVADLNRLTGSG